MRDKIGGPEIVIDKFTVESDDDDCLGGRVAVAAGPKGIDPADRGRKMMTWAIEINSTGFSVVGSQNPEAWPIAFRERVANPRNCIYEFRPADLFGKVSIVAQSKVPPGGINSGHGYDDGARDRDVEDQKDRDQGKRHL